MADVLAVAAALFFAVAATLQQKGALALGGQGEGHALLGLARQPWWLAGTGFLLLGYLAQAVALADGKLAIVQALLVTTIVFALPLGHWLTDQVVTRSQTISAALVALGLAVFTVFGDEGQGRNTAPAWQWAITFALFGGLALALVLVGRGGRAARRAAYLGAAAGILYALSAAMWKPTSAALGADGLVGMLTSWEFWAWIGAAAVAFVVQQVSLAAGQLAASVATVSVGNPIVSILIGIVVLQERLSGPTWHKLIALGGLCVAFAAAIQITQESQGETSGVAPDVVAAG